MAYCDKKGFHKDSLDYVRRMIVAKRIKLDVEAFETIVSIASSLVDRSLWSGSDLFDAGSLRRFLYAVVGPDAILDDKNQNVIGQRVANTIEKVIDGWTSAASPRTNELIQNVLLPLFPVLPEWLRAKTSKFIGSRLKLEWWNGYNDIFFLAVLRDVLLATPDLLDRFLSNLIDKAQHLEGEDVEKLDQRLVEIALQQIGILIAKRKVRLRRNDERMRFLAERNPFLAFINDPNMFDTSKIELEWLQWLSKSRLRRLADDEDKRRLIIDRYRTQVESNWSNKKIHEIIFRYFVC